MYKSSRTNGNIMRSIFLIITLIMSLPFNFIVAKELPSSEGILLKDYHNKSNTKLVLGEKIHNPYSVENMQKAASNLSLKLAISATHLYIKFMPTTAEQLDILESDSSLILYDHPLDNKIAKDGDYYHDPEIPESQPTYQYASVKKGQLLPTGVNFEILSELYIPDENYANKNNKEIIEIDSLVDEALYISGNLPSANQATLRRGRWRPTGKIRVWDNSLGEHSYIISKTFDHWDYSDCFHDKTNPKDEPDDEWACRKAAYVTVMGTKRGSYIPLEGVRVRARRYFTTYTGLTDANGHFSLNGRFRGGARYSIKWQRHDFNIKSSYWWVAKHNGPLKIGDWNWDISGGLNQYYSAILRAANHYFYENIKGLSRPSRWYVRKLNIRAYESFRSDLRGNFVIDLNQIAIRMYGRPSMKTYKTTIHEIAHLSHSLMDISAYTLLTLTPSGKRVQESWAKGVSWVLTKMVYDILNTGQRIERNNSNYTDYTGVVVDMMDEFTPVVTNENTNDVHNGGFNNLLFDSVEGYTIKQIEDALYLTVSWDQWRARLESFNDNPTEDNLVTLFDAWSGD